MPENNNPKKKSFMETYREINEREKAEELRRQSEAEAEKAEAERKERDKYAEKLQQDKLELLKLKQGVISEDDIPKEVKEEKQYTLKEKISNFFYHYKLTVIAVTAAAALLGYLVYDIATRVQPDVSVMFIAEDENVSFALKNMETVLERYCKDYNGDGKIKVRVSYVPASMTIAENSPVAVYAMQEMQANQTKLVAEFQAGDTIMIIADRKACEEVGIDEGVFADLSKVYPDDENVSELGYMLSGTRLAEETEYDGFSEELFIAFRLPWNGGGINYRKFEKNYSNALELWTNYINGNVVDPDDV